MENRFVKILSVIGESSRARILQCLLDGKAYTAGELAAESDLNPTTASNHLNKLLENKILKVQSQGRHRYYSFYDSEIAYAIEALGSIGIKKEEFADRNGNDLGIRYCRTCYDHLAGKVGVEITQILVKKEVLQEYEKDFVLKGINSEWIKALHITAEELNNKKRSFARKCLDWSERKPHVAGHLGALFLHKMLEKKWLKKKEFSREVIVTSEGQRQLYDLLGINL